ncbi:hypothetical protein TWF694_008869 [Orbilia ellipsospora]|uniref:Copper-fist domain-containing protein n=1 Tax=Orbilia ellipsospora TaxID=2528407 RepID=A0AAV9XGH5_9PEZI
MSSQQQIPSDCENCICHTQRFCPHNRNDPTRDCTCHHHLHSPAPVPAPDGNDKRDRKPSRKSEGKKHNRGVDKNGDCGSASTPGTTPRNMTAAS